MKIILSPAAEKDRLYWKQSGDKKSMAKIQKLVAELEQHPTTGTGQVEQLKGDWSGFWSRRINKKDRIIYKIDLEKGEVHITSMRDHYGEK